MCRLVAYVGAPIFPAALLAGKGGLIAQSLAAREAKTVVNGDGCGLGWYGELDEPGLYRGIRPAWSDPNLASLCRQVRTRLFCAHIRSATSGEVSVANCHPFAAGRHLFMHNGQVGGYDRVRRQLEALITDEHYGLRRGTGDSETIFLAALARGLNRDPIAAISRTLADIADRMADAGVSQALRFAAVHTDGQTLWAYRWSSDTKPPTLYWRHTTAGVVVVSEPMDNENWDEIKPGSVLTATIDAKVRTERLLVAA